MEQYVKKGISKSNGLEEVMERRATEKMQEYENVKLDALIAEEKKKLQESSPPSNVNSVQNTNIAATLFAGRTPNEIKQILSTLTQEEIDRLAYIASSTNQNAFASLRGAMQPQNSSLKETIEVIKLILSMQQPQQPTNNGFTMKDAAEFFKAAVEVARAQQAPVQQSQQDPMAVYKMVQEIVQPFQQQAANHERQLHEMQLKEAESRVVDPIAYVKNMKAMAADLGLTSSGATNEYALKKTELEQTERLETKKLDWEMQKWEKEKDADMKKYDIVKTVLEGPVGDVLKSIGNAGAARMRGNAPMPPNSIQASQTVSTPNVICPNCNKPFYADPSAQKVACPNCGVTLEKQEPPQPTQIPEQPQTNETASAEPIVEQPASVSGVVGTAH